MSQSLYTAAVGMKAQQQRIDTLANNIANVNTSGYKKSRVDFKDAIYQTMENPAMPADAAQQNLQLGQGLRIDAEKKIFADGQLLETGRSLDLAMSGSGFYALETPDGLPLYSRNGVFQSQESEGGYALVTTGGQYVLDQNGARITFHRPFDEMRVSEQGQIHIDDQFVGQLGLYEFVNPEGLEGAGNLNYRMTDASGAAQPSDTRIRQGYLEGSNVDLTEEMTRLIRAQRAYSLLGRAISTADQMKATENDIRR